MCPVVITTQWGPQEGGALKLIFSTPVALTTRLAGNQEHLGVLSTSSSRFKPDHGSAPMWPSTASNCLQGSGRIWALMALHLTVERTKGS